VALVWQRKVQQASGQVDDYQIRNAGKSLRLYRNKVFHTQYHPKRIVTGDIWELLLVASLDIPENSRILVLGAGGGAIVNLAQYFLKPKQIDVVDLDPTILYLCERFFLTKKNNVTLIESDAKDWLRANADSLHGKYDLIIEDLFGEESGQPVKIFALNEEWLSLLCQQLTSNGSLVVNFESFSQLSNSPVLKKRSQIRKQGFKSFIKCSSPRYQNNIALLSRTKIESHTLRSKILADKLLSKQNNNYFMRAF
jgi:spermidine synthase